MLKGTAIILPLIVAYTTWAHWVFRGKVAAQSFHE
jgi:cytochrome d ubiquinol oxidase subunit II